jgi:hypothetical protein
LAAQLAPIVPAPITATRRTPAISSVTLPSLLLSKSSAAHRYRELPRSLSSFLKSRA